MNAIKKNKKGETTMDNLKQEIEEKYYEILDDVEKGKCDIPEYACPYIDKVISEINRYVDEIEKMRKNYYRYDTIEDFANDIPDANFYDIINILDNKIRENNATLRELGKFWYYRYKDMKLLVEKFLQHP
ncbi:MAG: hypothetical protein GYA51_10440 [Candidatus Methanofastidiosa archaeon]|nr:hypothetical protein [Candidatus Methanofastidiosa archaeon]